MAIIQFLIAILATYRLAHLLPEDEGPFFIFTRIRLFIGTKAMMENNELGFWANVDSGINCVYCCGLYAAMLVSLLILWQNYYGNIFLLIFAIAGSQSLLQKWGKE
jgi:hypothetical protein